MKTTGGSHCTPNVSDSLSAESNLSVTAIGGNSSVSDGKANLDDNVVPC